jgi:hypothetical protein
MIAMTDTMQTRRKFERTKVSRKARLIFGDSGTTLDCLVLNLNTFGACIRLDDQSEIPEDVELTFDGARTLRSCRVAWRLDSRVGLSFCSTK